MSKKCEICGKESLKAASRSFSNKQNVKNIIRLITRQDNEDLEQEVYIKVWKNADKYEERGSFKSWINTVAKNVSKDYLKSLAFRNANNTAYEHCELAVNGEGFFALVEAI